MIKVDIVFGNWLLASDKADTTDSFDEGVENK